MTPETRRILRARKLRIIRWKIERNDPKIAIFIYILLIIVLLAFAHRSKPQAPVVVPTPSITPIATQSAVVAVHIPTDEEMIAALSNGPIVSKIYSGESSKGKHDGCKRSGKFNGFGFGWDGSHYPCYDTLAEVAGNVDSWISHHSYLPTKTMLCYYNLGMAGLQMKTCEYAERIMSL